MTLPKPARFQDDLLAILSQTQIIQKQYSDLYHFVYSLQSVDDDVYVHKSGSSDKTGNLVARNGSYRPFEYAEDAVKLIQGALNQLDLATYAIQRAFAWDAVPVDSIDPDDTPITDMYNYQPKH